jgi:hypothetical protein
MSGGGPILRIRSFRAMWQLYLEVLFLPIVIPMILGMALSPLIGGYGAIALFILGIAGGLYLGFFHNGLTGKWVEVLGTGWSWGPSIFPGEPSGI